MIGLRRYARDPELVVRAGEGALAPPSDAALLELVRACLWSGEGAPPASSELVYARWKPGVSLTTTHAVEFEDAASFPVTVKTYADPKAFTPSARESARVGRLAAGCDVPGEARVLSVFPTDRALPGAVRALDARRVARRLESVGVVPEPGISARRSAAHVLRYKPERRAVLRFEATLRQSHGARFTCALRALPPREAREHVRRRACIPDASLLPTLLDVEARVGILAEEWLEGVPGEHDDFTGLARVAALLSRLPAGSAQGEAPEAPRSVEAFAPLFAWSPRLSRRAAHFAPFGAPRPERWIHGDLHPDQLLRDPGGGVRLLDWDGLRAGEAAEDLASWTADRLAADTACSEPRRALDDGLATWARGAEDGAAAAAGPARARLAHWTAWELVARAAACVRRLEHGAEERALGLLDLALELAGDGSAA